MVFCLCVTLVKKHTCVILSFCLYQGRLNTYDVDIVDVFVFHLFITCTYPALTRKGLNTSNNKIVFTINKQYIKELINLTLMPFSSFSSSPSPSSHIHWLFPHLLCRRFDELVVFIFYKYWLFICLLLLFLPLVFNSQALCMQLESENDIG